MQFYEIYNSQVLIFRLHTVYNNKEMIKFGNQTKEKLQELSQVIV